MKSSTVHRPKGKSVAFLFRILPLTIVMAGIIHLQLSIAQSIRPTTRVIAADSLEAPWFNSSWAATVDFTNTEQVFSGSTSIKATLDAWGGLRLRSGDWNHPIGQDMMPYDTLSLRLQLASPGPVRVGLSNDDPSVSFTPVDLDSLPTDQWIHVQLSIAELGGTGKSADYVRVGNSTDTTRTFG